MSETKTETCSHDWQWLIVQAPETLQWCRLCGALKALNSPVVLPADHARAALVDALATALEFYADRQCISMSTVRALWRVRTKVARSVLAAYPLTQEQKA